MEDGSASECPYDEGVDFIKGAVIPISLHGSKVSDNYPYAYIKDKYIVFRPNELEILPDTPFKEEDWL